MDHFIYKQGIDKKAVADSFSKAATHYDQFSQLQCDIGQQLLDRVAVQQTKQIVDLGCGTGYFSEKLSIKFPKALITCFDLSNAMLKQAEKRNINNSTFQQGDIDNLPFSDNSQDIIYSNLVVQWSDDLTVCLKQIKNSLKEGGKAYLSTLLNGTLDELTQAWKRVDTHPHTNDFLTLDSLQNIFKQLAFKNIQLITETRTLHYKNVVEVMRALKGIGANHVHGHKSLKTSGRKLLKQLERGYQPYKNENGLLPLTYQICYIEITK